MRLAAGASTGLLLGWKGGPAAAFQSAAGLGLISYMVRAVALLNCACMCPFSICLSSFRGEYKPRSQMNNSNNATTSGLTWILLITDYCKHSKAHRAPHQTRAATCLAIIAPLANPWQGQVRVS